MSNEQETLFAATDDKSAAQQTTKTEVITVAWSSDGQWQQSNNPSERYQTAIAAMTDVENRCGKRSWQPKGTTTYEGCVIE
jgi:hypothetical protein